MCLMEPQGPGEWSPRTLPAPHCTPINTFGHHARDKWVPNPQTGWSWHQMLHQWEVVKKGRLHVATAAVTRGAWWPSSIFKSKSANRWLSTFCLGLATTTKVCYKIKSILITGKLCMELDTLFMQNHIPCSSSDATIG